MHGRTRQVAATALWVVVSLGLATVAVEVLHGRVGVPDASAVYLVAVVVCGLTAGTGAAILAAVGAFVVYNYFFTQPLYTLTINDPDDVLRVAMLLFVGVVVGQLAGMQRSRAETAVAREREARALFRVSRVLATRTSTDEALAEIVAVLRDEAGMTRAWIGFGPDPATERVPADTTAGPRPAAPARFRVLQRMPGDQPARWSLVHRPGQPVRQRDGAETYRVRIEASGDPLGSVWAERRREDGEPDPVQTRLLAGAADQIGQAVARDRIAAEAQVAELARRSDALKSSLLQSVSHDFRTPLAVIRAAAGSLDDASSLSPEDRQANLQAIEREVEYLDRLVANLLDLGRIEAGALLADRDVYELDDLLSRPLERARARLEGRTLEVVVEPVRVRVDPVFLDASLANVLDNAIKYTQDDARIRVSARALGDATMRLTVEDDGPGVPPDALGRLFEKFYRVPGARGGSRSGLGIGLAVVRGLTEAGGGRVSARASELGGLAVDFELPRASVPADSSGDL